MNSRTIDNLLINTCVEMFKSAGCSEAQLLDCANRMQLLGSTAHGLILGVALLRLSLQESNQATPVSVVSQMVAVCLSELSEVPAQVKHLRYISGASQ